MKARDHMEEYGNRGSTPTVFVEMMFAMVGNGATNTPEQTIGAALLHNDTNADGSFVTMFTAAAVIGWTILIADGTMDGWMME